MRVLKFVCAGAFSMGFSLLYASIAFAEEVALELRGGNFMITGKLLNYDGKNYVVHSPTLGDLTISVEKFHCVRGACPTGETASLGSYQTTLRVAGSATLAGMLPGLLREYAKMKDYDVGAIGKAEQETVKLHDKAGELVQTFEFGVKDSNFAFEALKDGHIDIGMASRPISDSEIGAFAQAGHPMMNQVGRQHVVALDGLVIVVSKDNPINSLSIEDLAKIFSGEISDWSELGWEKRSIKVYSHGMKSGTNATFATLVLEPFRRDLTSAAISHASDEELAKAIALDRGGIGFVSFSQEHNAKALNIKDSCGITHRPTRFGVKAGEYPLSRELYFYTSKIVRSDIADFVEFSVSENGYEAVRNAGFVHRGVTISAFDDFVERIVVSLIAPQEDFDLDLMRQLARDLGAGVRLSTTVRFDQSGAVQISGESSQQLSTIIDYLSKQDLVKNQAILAGFSDSTGLFETNLAVSLKRANAVRDALLTPGRSSLMPEDVIARSYGELLPVACNDTKDGRSKNRRVEVWLVPRQAGPLALNRQP